MFKFLFALLAVVGLSLPAQAQCRSCQAPVFSTTTVAVNSGVFAFAVPGATQVTTVTEEVPVQVQSRRTITTQTSQQAFFQLQPVQSFTVFTPVAVAVAVPTATVVNVNVKNVQRRGLLGRIFH